MESEKKLFYFKNKINLKIFECKNYVFLELDVNGSEVRSDGTIAFIL